MKIELDLFAEANKEEAVKDILTVIDVLEASPYSKAIESALYTVANIGWGILETFIEKSFLEIEDIEFMSDDEKESATPVQKLKHRLERIG